MKKKLHTKFSTRQYMLSKDFEIYYYKDDDLSKVKAHTHDYYEFYFFLEGDVSIQISDKEMRLQYGDIIIIPPGVEHHAIVHTTTQPYRRFVFWISKDYCNQLISQNASYGYIMQQVQTTKEYVIPTDFVSFNTIQTKVFHLIEEIHGNRFGKTAKVDLCVMDLIFHINRISYEQTHVNVEKEKSSLYENIISYIEEHLEEELSLDSLAKEFYVSKYHIAHIFKENMGLSTHQYITKKRILACKDGILNDNKITEVYLRYGFKDYTSFYRAFKKEYGISPKACKEKEGNMEFLK